MNKELLNSIHRYAEDREIDYISAQIIGERYGKKFPDQATLIEWKQLVDKYLKTFDPEAFEALEEELGLIEGKGETFKCPECGTKVLKASGYCVKCKKKVGDSKKDDDDKKDKKDDKDDKKDKKDKKKKMEESKYAVECPKCGRSQDAQKGGDYECPVCGIKMKATKDEKK